MLEQGQHTRRRADFQRRGKRAHVRVANEQVQPAIFPIICERLIARVDDRTIELHPLIDVVHDVIGALADLKIDARFALRNFEIKRERVRLPHSARAGENLPRGEEREQRPKDGRRELRLALHEVVLVTTKRRAGVMIDVILDE